MKEADYFSTEHACTIDVKHFNAAMSKSRKWGTAMLCFDGTNITIVWHVMYDGVYFYMFSEPCQQVQYPAMLDIAWCQEVYHSETGISDGHIQQLRLVYSWKLLMDFWNNCLIVLVTPAWKQSANDRIYCMKPLLLLLLL